MDGLKGLATGVGSLPHDDPQAALDLIFKYVPSAPFWPQLPKCGIREGMVAQFSENIPCLKVSNAGLVFNGSNRDKELELFYERVIAEDIDYFKIGPHFASGLHLFYQRIQKDFPEKAAFIKCQVTGPFTFAAAINDENGRAILYDSVLMQAIVKAISFKAIWQINLFKKFNKEIIVFFDEPFLSCFGSAYTPLNRDEVVRVLTELTAAVKPYKVLLGVHCCGNTDWSIFSEIAGIDIISFDAFDFLERFLLYADGLRSFLKRGGVISWGIVPTRLFTGEESPDMLIRKLKQGIDSLSSKGIEESLLRRNMIITPSCGLGTFSPEKSEKVFKLLAETASFLGK